MASFLWCWRGVIIELHCPPLPPYLHARRHLSCSACVRALLQGEQRVLFANAAPEDLCPQSTLSEDFLALSSSSVFWRSFMSRIVFDIEAPANDRYGMWIKTLLSRFDLRMPTVLARFFSVLHGPCTRPAYASCLPVTIYVLPLLRKCMYSRGFATDAATEGQRLLQLDEVYKILNGVNRPGYDEMDSALGNMAIEWASRLIVREVLQHIRDPQTSLDFLTWVIDRKGFCPTSVEYNAVLEALGSAEMFSKMRRVIEDMNARKIKLITSTFTILIKYYGKAGLVDEAIKTLSLMKSHGVPANVQTYNNLLNAFVKEGRLELALGIFEQMLASNISPNEYTVNFLTDGLCAAGRLEEATKLVKEAPVSNIFVYNVLLKGLCKAGKMEEGYKLLEELNTKGFSPDEYSYNTLVVGFCKAGKLDMALKLRQEMLDKHVAPTLITYGTLITFLCKSNRGEEAFHLLANMVSEKIVLTPEAQVSLGMAFSKTKRKASAAELLKKLRENS